MQELPSFEKNAKGKAPSSSIAKWFEKQVQQKETTNKSPFLFHNSTKALIISSLLLFIVPEISWEKPM
jgi:hypothetical protein